jgi:hypothetical protein
MLSRYDLDHKGSNMNDDSEFSRGASVFALTRRRYRPQARRFAPAGFCLPSAAIAALLRRLYFQREYGRGDWYSEVV